MAEKKWKKLEVIETGEIGTAVTWNEESFFKAFVVASTNEPRPGGGFQPDLTPIEVYYLKFETGEIRAYDAKALKPL